MAQGGGSQEFLRKAEQGRIEHRATASAAAANMNALKPARGAGGGAAAGSYVNEYQDMYANLGADAASFLPDPGRVNQAAKGPSAREGDSGAPMKIDIDDHSAPQDPTFGMGADVQVQAAQAAMMAQMQMGAAMGAMGPMGMYPMGMSPQMGFNPWGYMDPSFMMGGKGGMGMNPYAQMGGMGAMPFGAMPKASGMAFGGGGGKGGKGGGGKGGKGGEKQGGDKERRKRGSKNAKGGRAPSPTPEADDANINRSAVLTEVRRNHGKCKFSLAEVMPHILEFAKDQHGSRFLQTKLEESGEEDRLVIFEAILPHTKMLASDVFGNFVVQKLFDIFSKDLASQLATQLEGAVMSLANDTYGCRVIQKAMQHLPRETQQLLASELKDHVGACIESMHGNHVIQKCIEQMPPDSVNFIINEVNEKVDFWASHMYGCRVIQRLLEHCTTDVQLPKMLDAILLSIKKLAMDPFGNYVVQHMLEHGRKEDKAKIIHVVASNILLFSANKCSSNVVEKCFEHASIGEHATQLEKDRQLLYASVVGNMGDPNVPLLQMLDDRFANYIVQRMIEYSKGDDRVMLQQKLMSVEHMLKNSNNGKHILNALHKEFGGRGE